MSTPAKEIFAPVAIRYPEVEPKWLGRYLERTKRYSSPRLVVELAFLSLTVETLVHFALVLALGDSYANFWDAYRSKVAMIPYIWILILIGPVFETVLFQWIPIKITSLLTSRCEVLVLVSAILFAVIHGNVYQAIHVFFDGVLLGWIFIIKWNESFKKAFWLTTAVHILCNIFAFGSLYI